MRRTHWVPDVAATRRRRFVLSTLLFRQPGSRQIAVTGDGSGSRVGRTPRGAGATWDVALYALSAAVALVVPLTTHTPLDRAWARVATIGYVGGAAVALVLRRRRATVAARAVLAVAVFSIVGAIPMLVHAASRIGPGTAHVKSDVLVVEQASASLVHGRNPYTAVYVEEGLWRWPASTRAHFPYLPATLAVGVPRETVGASVWTDARVIYLTTALALVVPSLRLARAGPEGRLRVIQVLVVLVTGAPLVFTSGKEIFVLALLLAALVALDRGRVVTGGALVGIACASHQLAWVLLPILGLASSDPTPRRRGRLVAAIGAVVALVIVAPFVFWDAGAFIDDAVLFPLALEPQTHGASFTPGSFVASVLSGGRWVLVGILGLVLVVATVLVTRRWPNGSAAAVARGAGVLLVVVLLLSPRVRTAYFAFPLNLLLWGHVLVGEHSATPEKVDPDVGVATEQRPAGGSPVAG